MTREEIEKLTPQERVAGYLSHSSQLAYLGARLRVAKEDEEWTSQEELDWDAAVDALDNWYYSIKEDEWETIKIVESILAKLTRGEWPVI